MPKNKNQQKGAVWHIISNPLDPTRRTNEDPPIPSLYWQDLTSIKINGLESGKPFCHRPHRTSSTLKMSSSCHGILHHLNRVTMIFQSKRPCFLATVQITYQVIFLKTREAGPVHVEQLKGSLHLEQYL